ncbi:MAG: 2-oxo acid dehydrogenase subunit E2, partial [Pseudomonadota bacterium]|nr:2-oxo acid dehydrogenase subunit E2 [Pseudomonadota bacterium]
AVMTDKATVEIPSPVDGEVVWLGAEIGDTVAVGAPLIRLAIAGEPASGVQARARSHGEKQYGEGDAAPATEPEATPSPAPPPMPAPAAKAQSHPQPVPDEPPAQPTRKGAVRAAAEQPIAAPAVRLRAREAGIDLRQLSGSGPAGRITHEDLDDFIAGGPHALRPAGLQRNDTVEEIRIVGLRRKIAEKMALANSRIPHITYVEEVDVGAVEDLRAELNKAKRPDQPRLTLLPFLMRAMVRAIAEQPAINALFDDQAGVIHQHGGVHIGIATQTPSGLVVPVVHHAEARDLWACGAELNRLVEAARAGAATREELTGSTITITSLGAMGGIVTTPVINHPEVAIVGVNKIMVRPVWDGAQFIPCRMMNLSSSFDHRVVDGWDAAMFIQRIKALLETPAMIFMEG